MSSGIAPDAYCREVESYLCRKNDGHLIRLVGPAFELVRGWAQAGVPLTIVCRGVDQYFERYYAKGPRRRPVRVEFCAGDVLSLFEHWRRATGISLEDAAAGAVGVAPAKAARRSLAGHLERLGNRLDECRSRAAASPAFAEVVARLHGEVHAAREHAKGLRGEARSALLNRLEQLDLELITVARTAVSAERRAELVRVAQAELEPFRGRMTDVAFARAVETSADRLIRDELGLPTLPLR